MWLAGGLAVCAACLLETLACDITCELYNPILTAFTILSDSDIYQVLPFSVALTVAQVNMKKNPNPFQSVPPPPTHFTRVHNIWYILKQDQFEDTI